jgi:hypothetical protein
MESSVPVNTQTEWPMHASPSNIPKNGIACAVSASVGTPPPALQEKYVSAIALIERLGCGGTSFAIISTMFAGIESLDGGAISKYERSGRMMPTYLPPAVISRTFATTPSQVA